MMILLRLLCIALMLALAGCATPPPVLPPTPAAVQIPEHVWQQVDQEILSESAAAKAQATGFARRQMERWRQLAADRAETDFIPWFSSYTTQQWLTVKVAWYKLNTNEGDDSQPEERLAAYLQEQYYERVLAPVAKEVDPVSLVGQSTKLFTQHLRQGLRAIPSRHGIPEDRFAQRLKGIRAIALTAPPAHNATLHDIVSTDPIDSLPAYLALLKRIREAGNNDGIGLSKTRISPVAQRISEKLLNQLAISGGAGATSTLIGGVVGSVISVGAMALGVLWHEAKRQDIEIALRETLNAAQDDMWKILMDDPDSAVSAGIYHIFEQIEGSLPQTFSHAMTLDAPPQAIPLPEIPVPATEAKPDEN